MILQDHDDIPDSLLDINKVILLSEFAISHLGEVEQIICKENHHLRGRVLHHEANVQLIHYFLQLLGVPKQDLVSLCDILPHFLEHFPNKFMVLLRPNIAHYNSVQWIS